MTGRRSADELIEAVVDAAHRLFVQRAPSAVSMREIAAEADVNLGLIHRYVGSKDDLIAMVLARHTRRARAIVDEHGEPDDVLHAVAHAVATRPESGRLIAGLILDGADVAAVKNDFPLLDALGAHTDPLDAALSYALALGWEVFGPALLAASGVRPRTADLEVRLERALRDVSRT